jgi:hypothetical protein
MCDVPCLPHGLGEHPLPEVLLVIARGHAPMLAAGTD